MASRITIRQQKASEAAKKGWETRKKKEEALKEGIASGRIIVFNQTSNLISGDALSGQQHRARFLAEKTKSTGNIRVRVHPEDRRHSIYGSVTCVLVFKPDELEALFTVLENSVSIDSEIVGNLVVSAEPVQIRMRNPRSGSYWYFVRKGEQVWVSPRKITSDVLNFVPGKSSLYKMAYIYQFDFESLKELKDRLQGINKAVGGKKEEKAYIRDESSAGSAVEVLEKVRDNLERNQ